MTGKKPRAAIRLSFNETAMRALLISLPYPVCQRMAVCFIIQTTQTTIRLFGIELYILLFHRGIPFFVSVTTIAQT